MFRMTFGQEHLDEAEEQINGEKATVMIPGQESQHLVRVGKVWKIGAAPGGSAETNTYPKAGMFDALARAANEMTQEVREGRYQSAAQANAALRRKMLAAIKQ